MVNHVVRGARRRAQAVVLALVGLGIAGVSLPAAPTALAVGEPNAPSGLAADLGSGIVAVFWADNSNDETGFEIERCTPSPTGCVFGPLATVPANQYAYADQNVAPAEYRYRVRAVNAAGVSAWSAETTVPWNGFITSPVAVMTATPTTGTTPLTVAFDGTASYGIDLSTVVAWSWSFGDGTTASGPTATHTYTAPGTYRAALTVTENHGYAHLTATTITVDIAPLVAPTGLTATSPVRRRVDLRWTNPASTRAVSLIVQRCAGARCSSFARVTTLPATATSWSDTTVRSGTTYRYRLVAVDATSARVNSLPVTIRAR